jgi:radical SAM superfamily enzyme YgiQ (UPF0313 family)
MPNQKILLVYIGNEQGSWGATAYPKPAHYYIMPGILYCAQSLLKDTWIQGRYDVSCRFFNTTVESREEILAAISNDNASFVGFSVFCWNAPDTFWLVNQLRSSMPGCCIAGGGPEVALKNDAEAQAFFSENPGFDMLVFGEAESKIGPLVKAAITHEPLVPAMTGYAFSPRLGGAFEFTTRYVENADLIPSIYPFALDIKRSPSCGLAMVYEAGRGCPYRCIYCQFSHRNHKPYRFPAARVKKELAWLFGQGIECIHFADAVFDLDPAFAKDILSECIRLNRRTSLFFYCSFYKLDDELARLFAASQAQICVGVQTTNPEVLAKINRTLNPRLFSDIRDILLRHNLNFYIDLIFGLPLDSIESFWKSFTDSLAIGPSFIMVFPLTLIKGTVLEQHAVDYGMKTYARSETEQCCLMCGIEYRNIALYAAFSLTDLVHFDDLALSLFYFFNRFRMSLSYLEKRCGPDTAGLYQRIGMGTKSFLRKTGETATNTNFISGFENEIRALFVSEMSSAGAGEQERAAFEEIFKLDIFRILMTNSAQREKMFLQSANKNTALQSFSLQTISDDPRILRIAPGKAVHCAYRLSDLRQLHVLRETIKPVNDTVFISAPYSRWDVQAFSLSSLEKSLLEMIPADRPIKLGQLVQTIKRAHATVDNASTMESDIRNVIALLAERGIITV